MSEQQFKRILITIDRELLDRIDRVNRAAGIRRGRSWLLREALSTWLATTPFERGAIEKLKGASDD
jgi:metal-responsive CopG/Arc/MetJ family transcriptional regulator